MDRRIPVMLQELVEDYCNKLCWLLGDKLYGVYLYGSISLNSFDEGSSDIDFVVITVDPLDASSIEKLQLIHSGLCQQHPMGDRLDGFYMPFRNIGRMNNDIEPYPYFSEGQFCDSGYWDVNSVTWWLLKHRGIALTGRPISELGIEVGWQDLKRTMDYNLNYYWKSKSYCEDSFLEDAEVVWSVLTICRIIYTLRYQTITSKIDAGRFYIEAGASEWKTLVREAINIRMQTGARSYYDSKCERAREVVRFIKAAIQDYDAI